MAKMVNNRMINCILGRLSTGSDTNLMAITPKRSLNCWFNGRKHLDETPTVAIRVAALIGDCFREPNSKPFREPFPTPKWGETRCHRRNENDKRSLIKNWLESFRSHVLSRRFRSEPGRRSVFDVNLPRIGDRTFGTVLPSSLIEKSLFWFGERIVTYFGRL